MYVYIVYIYIIYTCIYTYIYILNHFAIYQKPIKNSKSTMLLFKI